MTWFSLISKPLSVVVVLPLLLKNYSSEEVALWYLFSLFISMQLLADFGFYSTFIRVISYAFAGNKNIENISKISSRKEELEPNRALLKDIIGVMNYTYCALSIVILTVFTCFSFVIASNINKIPDPSEGWFAWILIIVFTAVNFYSRIFSNFLMGFNKVAQVRRIEGIFSLISLIATALAVYFNLDIQWIILLNQFWYLPNLVVLKFFADRVTPFHFKELTNYSFNKKIFKDIWDPAWKSGLSTLTSHGFTNLTGIIYAKFSNSVNLTEYLLAIKFINVISSFSQAPFYSKLPMLSFLASKGEIETWRKKSAEGMLLGSAFFVGLIIILSEFGPLVFKYMPGQIKFPEFYLWLLLGIGNYFHRIGGMHSQLYMTTNKVKAHISDTISGSIYLIISIFLIKQYGVMGFPIGLIAGYALFYTPYSLYYSSKIIQTSIIDYERKANLLPLLILLCYMLFKMTFKF